MVRKRHAATRYLLWRWRRNPLRRGSDVVEAWIVLATWVLALLGAVVAGLAVASAAEEAFAQRRAEAHAVSAVLTEDAADARPAERTGYHDTRVWATARWTAPDGSVHTGRAKAAPGTDQGTRVTLWTDDEGRLVAKPPSAMDAALQAAAAGVLVTPVTGAAVWYGGTLFVRHLMRRRLAEWDAEWKRVGPRWNNLSGGRG
jgi:hypothetical protein